MTERGKANRKSSRTVGEMRMPTVLFDGNITFGIFCVLKTGTIVTSEKIYINKCCFGGRGWEYMV